MSRTFKKFDGEKEQREQYFRSEREASKRKKAHRESTPAHYLVDDHLDDDIPPLNNNYIEYYD